MERRFKAQSPYEGPPASNPLILSLVFAAIAIFSGWLILGGSRDWAVIAVFVFSIAMALVNFPLRLGDVKAEYVVGDDRITADPPIQGLSADKPLMIGRITKVEHYTVPMASLNRGLSRLASGYASYTAATVDVRGSGAKVVVLYTDEDAGPLRKAYVLTPGDPKAFADHVEAARKRLTAGPHQL